LPTRAPALGQGRCGDLGGRPETSEKIVAALEKAGVEFIDEDNDGPGVRLRKRDASKPKKGN
jgi:hypothetical protein